MMHQVSDEPPLSADESTVSVTPSDPVQAVLVGVGVGVGDAPAPPVDAQADRPSARAPAASRVRMRESTSPLQRRGSGASRPDHGARA
jgi:hypothetical protein